MISEQKLLELVVGLNAECDRQGPVTNNLNNVGDNYSIDLDKDGNLTKGGGVMKDGVIIFRDTFDVWGAAFRPASRFGPPMRYDNPVELVRAALARQHWSTAYFLDQGEVRRLRGR